MYSIKSNVSSAVIQIIKRNNDTIIFFKTMKLFTILLELYRWIYRCEIAYTNKIREKIRTVVYSPSDNSCHVGCIQIY